MPLLIPCTERDSLFKILPLKMNHFHRYDETDNFFTGNLTILKKCENLFTGKLLKGILSSIGTKRHHRCLLFYIFYVTVTLNGTRLCHTFLVDSFFVLCAVSACIYSQNQTSSHVSRLLLLFCVIRHHYCYLMQLDLHSCLILPKHRMCKCPVQP